MNSNFIVSMYDTLEKSEKNQLEEKGYEITYQAKFNHAYVLKNENGSVDELNALPFVKRAEKEGFGTIFV